MPIDISMNDGVALKGQKPTQSGLDSIEVGFIVRLDTFRVGSGHASQGSADSVWMSSNRPYSYTQLISDGELGDSTLWGTLPNGTTEINLGGIETQGYVGINLFCWDTDQTVNSLGTLFIDSDGDVFLNTNPVPIPSAVWLLGSGLLCLIGYRRKFRREA